MLRKAWILVLVLSLVAWTGAVVAEEAGTTSINGTVVDQDGNPIGGAKVTAFDEAQAKTITAFSQEDGTFELSGVPEGDLTLRARLIGLADTMIDISAGGSAAIEIAMKPATPDVLSQQRPGNKRLDLIRWDSEQDLLNFKMHCAYCHQIGTEGFRTPEEPVDWEVMVTRMNGFRGLSEHSQETLVDRLLEVYGPDAEKSWPEYQAPAAPTGPATKAIITEWNMGKEADAVVHDLELGTDGLIYAVDMSNDALLTLDPKTGEREVYSFPGGKDFDSTDNYIIGPHSIEAAANGDMWITCAGSGQMAKFDVKTKEFTFASSAPAPRSRGMYPHTLRVAPDGMVWYTDAGTNSVFSIHPDTMVVKEYKLLSADQAIGTGVGESRGRTPYGIDIAPDGKIWFTKLNAQRVGRVDPSKPDGDPEQIIEWAPPIVGPRRLHVAPDGLVWVPGWASGDIASFNEETGEWKVYDLPHGPNSLPYALNIHPQTGDIWICGTGTDSMLRFDPKTETFTEYLMPTIVTYTREVEFDDEGNVWICNSNVPARHIENMYGSIIKLEYDVVTK